MSSDSNKLVSFRTSVSSDSNKLVSFRTSVSAVNRMQIVISRYVYDSNGLRH